MDGVVMIFNLGEFSTRFGGDNLNIVVVILLCRNVFKSLFVLGIKS